MLAYTPLLGRKPPSLGTTAADGMHPTGMHSCLSILLLYCNSVFHQGIKDVNLSLVARFKYADALWTFYCSCISNW